MVRDGKRLRRVCTRRIGSTLAERSLPVRIGVPGGILRTQAPVFLGAPETGGSGLGAHGQGKTIDGALQTVDSRPVGGQRDRAPRDTGVSKTPQNQS